VRPFVLVPPQCSIKVEVEGTIPTGPGEHQVCATFGQSTVSFRACHAFRLLAYCGPDTPVDQFCFVGGIGSGGPGGSGPSPSQQQHLAIQEAWDQLTKATLTYNLPRSIALGTHDYITVYVYSSPPSSPLGAEGSGSRISTQVRVSNRVSVSLTPDDSGSVSVRLIEGQPIEALIDGTPSKWEWIVNAIQPGPQRLRLQMSIELNGTGFDYVQPLSADDLAVNIPDNVGLRFREQISSVTLLEWLTLVIAALGVTGAGLAVLFRSTIRRIFDRDQSPPLDVKSNAKASTARPPKGRNGHD